MPDFDMTCVIFIDYDNLSRQQKIKGLLDIITQALVQMPFWGNLTRVKCNARIYGGWYEGETLTRDAQDVTGKLQKDFPTSRRLPMRNNGVQVTFSIDAELAVALIQEPGHLMFDTYRRKGKPRNIQVERPEDVGCDDKECFLPLVKKILNDGKCPKTECKVRKANLIYRHEQKIVDTMLSCDMIYAANEKASIALMSSDDDFLPPLRTVILQGTKVVRFHTQPNNHRVSCSVSGTTLLEMDL